MATLTLTDSEVARIEARVLENTGVPWLLRPGPYATATEDCSCVLIFEYVHTFECPRAQPSGTCINNTLDNPCSTCAARGNGYCKVNNAGKRVLSVTFRAQSDVESGVAKLYGVGLESAHARGNIHAFMAFLGLTRAHDTPVISGRPLSR